MRTLNISQQRLANQHLAGTKLDKPGDVVKWLVAVQAQDYLGSLWAVGLRMQAAVEADIERALADKEIIRTWPMRGTLHFVAAADIKWLLELLTPRIVKGSASRLRKQFGLDEAIFTQSKKILVGALEGGKQIRRDEIYRILEANQINTADGRGLHIVSRLSEDGVICFGAREGKQQTFALLDEWAPTARRLKRDEALAELAGRYFTGHGPATWQDFAWWSGLVAGDAKTAVEMVQSQFEQETIDGQRYLFASSIEVNKTEAPTGYLLPAYDEYTVAYKDRSAALSPEFAKLANSGYGIFNPTIVIDGQIVGTWKRALRKDALLITPSPFKRLNDGETRAVAAAANRYGEFLGLPVLISS